MRLHRFTLHNIGPFRDATLDLDTIPGTVVAVCGSNWAGKTTSLEAGFAGALYRETPTRGSLRDLATARDSHVEARVGDFVIRQIVDSHTGASKALVKHADGRVLVESGGARDFDRWAAGALPPPELFFASVFGAQGSTGFLGMGASERKRVLLRALGIEKLEALAEKARAKASNAGIEAKTLAARLDDERRRTTPIDAAQAAHDAALRAMTGAREDAEQRQETLANARRAASTYDLALAAARAHEERREELRRERLRHEEGRAAAEGRRAATAETCAYAAEHRSRASKLDDRRAYVAELEAAERTAAEYAADVETIEGERRAAEARLADLERRRTAIAASLAERDAVRALADKVPALREQLARIEETERNAAADIAQAERDAKVADEGDVAASKTANRERARAESARRRAAALAGVEEAEQRLSSLRADVEIATEAREAAGVEVERLRAAVVGGKDHRIGLLRGGLTIARDEGGTLELIRQMAGEHLAEDDALAAEHAAAPANLRAAERVLADQTARARAAEQALQQAERLAAQRGALDAARAEEAEARAAAEHADAEQDRQRAIAETARGKAGLRATERDAAAREVRDIRRQLTDADRAAARLPELARAEATIAGFEEAIDKARAEIARSIERVEDLGEAPFRPTAEELTQAREALARSEASARRLPALIEAEATLRALEDQIAGSIRAISKVDARMATLGPAPSVPPAPDLALLEDELRRAEQAARDAIAAHARADAALGAARDGAARIVDMEQRLRAAEQIVADWTLIARGLGRDGVQALEIDAAGPELTSLINDLLYNSFGTRFTVEIRTTRAKADGKGDREVCDVIVTEAGVEKEGCFLSGAGKAIVGLAIRRALSILSCRRLAMIGPVFVEDESDAPLSDENSRAFVWMLRRTAEITGASKVIFISHNADAIALADAKVLVRDGRIDVEGVESPARQLAFEEERAAA